MPKFGQAGDGFAGETEVDDFALPAGRARADDSLDEIDVGPGVGNTVAEEDDPFGRGERRRKPPFMVSDGERVRLGGERGQRRREEKKKAHSARVKRWDSAERSVHEWKGVLQSAAGAGDEGDRAEQSARPLLGLMGGPRVRKG